MKIYAYENHEGDKGIVIAETEEKAAEIFHKEYPDKKIVDNDRDWRNGNTFLYEVGTMENNKLFNVFPWQRNRRFLSLKVE